MLRHIALAGLLVPATPMAQGARCISRRAGSVPAEYAATVAQERTLVCERLATRIPGRGSIPCSMIRGSILGFSCAAWSRGSARTA